VAVADLHFDVVIAQQKVELFGEIVAEQPRLGDAHRIDAGLGQPAPRAAGGRSGGLAAIVDAQLGIHEGAGAPPLLVGPLATGDVILKGGSQVPDRAVEAGGQFIEIFGGSGHERVLKRRAV
jgi:hypothetical protein